MIVNCMIQQPEGGQKWSFLILLLFSYCALLCIACMSLGKVSSLSVILLLTERKKKISLHRKITTFFLCRFLFQKIASRPMLISSYRLLCFTDKNGFSYLCLLHSFFTVFGTKAGSLVMCTTGDSYFRVRGKEFNFVIYTLE